MNLPQNRAIDTNSLNGNPFPVSIDFSKENDLFRVFLTPLGVLEVINMVPGDMFLVFNVDSYAFFDEKTNSLAKAANEYSAYLREFDEQTLLMRKADLVSLLNEISHYNFCLIDAGPDIELDKVIQIIDLADRFNDADVINQAGSNVFLSSHDDCYLYVETNNEKLALDLISLQIKILIATVSDCPIGEITFDPKELATADTFSIIIPQNPINSGGRISWEVFKATFEEFIYQRDEIIRSDFNLVYYETDKEIKIERV